jgi:hypothetical protein
MVVCKNRSGVFDTSSATPLQVLVDMKTDGQMYDTTSHETSVE